MRPIDGDELITAFPAGETVTTESVVGTIRNMPTLKNELPTEYVSTKELQQGIMDFMGSDELTNMLNNSIYADPSYRGAVTYGLTLIPWVLNKIPKYLAGRPDDQL